MPPPRHSYSHTHMPHTHLGREELTVLPTYTQKEWAAAGYIDWWPNLRGKGRRLCACAQVLLLEVGVGEGDTTKSLWGVPGMLSTPHDGQASPSICSLAFLLIFLYSLSVYSLLLSKGMKRHLEKTSCINPAALPRLYAFCLFLLHSI